MAINICDKSSMLQNILEKQPGAEGQPQVVKTSFNTLRWRIFDL